MNTDATSGAVRLNLGAGDAPLDGWQNLDAKTGDQIFPLACPDGTVDAIRASHVLEHFSLADSRKVLRNWVEKLKPGGTLSIAVPDYDLVRQLPAGQAQGYMMGGQVDERDFHKTLFDAATLTRAMSDAGLLLIREWKSEIQDCAALPVSLNLMGTKPHGANRMPRTAAVMSCPRLGFMDMLFCAFEALPPLRIPFFKVGGAFWGPRLQYGMEMVLRDGPLDYVLTLDYDSVFTRKNVADLIALAECYPEAHAIAPVQGNRHKDSPLLTLPGLALSADGNKAVPVERTRFAGDLVPIRTAHFGLTLLRADRLQALPKPWFQGHPGEGGSWDAGSGKVDEDIHFWREWEKAGNTLMLAANIPIGHAELMVRWPDVNLAAHWQTMSDWQEGKTPPPGTWAGA